MNTTTAKQMTATDYKLRADNETMLLARITNQLTLKVDEDAIAFQDRQTHRLGCAIANFTGFDGIAIMRIFAEALEDANWHSECAQVRGWIAAQE